MDFEKEKQVLEKLLQKKEIENKFSGVVYIKNGNHILFSGS